MRLPRLILIPFLLACVSAFSQHKSLQATKIGQAPKIDGILNDSAWTKASIATDFIQNFPQYGIPASTRTEVKVVYDNNAIYIAARLYDDPALIRKQITARDAEQQSDLDYFSVFLDTYNDDQNGFQFLVTSMNVQTDERLGPNLGGDINDFGDRGWDAVWDSKVAMDNEGWTVEMKIPYISIRFSKKDIQDWGIQFLRFTRRNNEQSYWSEVDPKINGFVNQFGDLKGLVNLQPPLRLSFSPYITTGYRKVPQKTNYSNEWLRNGGMDVKYGINESFTLDATLIPDFGQVVSDNVINNLSPYEVRFQENRPFFTEGTELFNKSGLFYSRRVGATPPGYYDVHDAVEADPDLSIVKNPSVTQLYNAIKFSGRTKKKLGIGVFNAVTAPMYATVRDNNTLEKTKIETAPLTNYNLIVLDQALKNQSYITLTNANTIRNGKSRDANVTALDVTWYNKKNDYSIRATGRYSKIWGTDPYDGYNTTLNAGKVGGKWQYFGQINVESENYDPNDLGILSAPNEISYRGGISYRIFSPTKNFITYNYSIDIGRYYLFSPNAYYRTDLTAEAFWVFKNFWDVSLSTTVNPGWSHDYFELRTPGLYLDYPSNYFFELSGSTDSRKKLYVRFGAEYAKAPEYNNQYYAISLGARYRFSNKFTLDLQTDKGVEFNQLGYAFEREMNNDPIVAFRDNYVFTSVLSGIYNFTPRLNLTLRARHYWNRVNYINFHNVGNDGKLTSRMFIPSKDQNINIFNIDAFCTWDFRLGSRLILGYKNWLGDEELVMSQYKGYLKNFGRTFSLRHANEFTVKFIYFLDYNQFRKKPK